MASTLRPLLGLLLTGYGLLVLARVLAHESLLAGTLSLCIGLGLLAGSVPSLRLRGSRLIATVGIVLVSGVVTYNVAARSALGPPEWALVLYGAALAAAAPFLSHRVGRVEIGSVVAWSFPILLAPMLLFALNASLSSPAAGTAASPIVQWFIVLPTVFLLRLLGMDVGLMGSSMLVPTARGVLTLDVGLVCAGLYPMILFGGLIGLHAWREGLGRRHLLGLVLAGLVGLWLVNLVRLVALTHVGATWGAGALQRAHANLGWLLFALFMVVFWLVALRIDGKARATEAGPAAPQVGSRTP